MTDQKTSHERVAGACRWLTTIVGMMTAERVECSSVGNAARPGLPGTLVCPECGFLVAEYKSQLSQCCSLHS